MGLSISQDKPSKLKVGEQLGIDTRKINTSVRSGKTIVLGSVYGHKETSNVSKVSFLETFLEYIFYLKETRSTMTGKNC